MNAVSIMVVTAELKWIKKERERKRKCSVYLDDQNVSAYNSNSDILIIFIDCNSRKQFRTYTFNSFIYYFNNTANRYWIWYYLQSKDFIKINRNKLQSVSQFPTWLVFTGSQKAYCVFEFAKSQSAVSIQRKFHTKYG